MTIVRTMMLALCATMLVAPAPVRAATCQGSGSTAKCTLDADCCAGLVCNKRCQRGCKIGGVFYDNGARNPQNDCQSCQSLVNRFGWTNLAVGTTCGGSPSGQCDLQNTCDGSGVCIDNVKFATTACTGASNGGICDDDARDHCSGTTNKTCMDAFKASTTVCRSAAGQCDVAESCTGTSGACPADAVAAATVSCTGTSNGGPCDGADHCSGTNKTCVDVFAPSATVCRSSAGQCDVAESCTGTSGACPTDAVAAATVPCTGTSNGGPCDGADHCNGTDKTCVDVFASSATVCRSSAGVCDVAETCTGSGGACPPDDYAAPSVTCRAAAGDCDLPEHCTGLGPACPADEHKLPGVVCRAADGPCDLAEKCDGGPACPADSVQPGGAVCRSAAGFCDVAETCDGTAKTCPADVFAPSTTVCRQAGATDVGGSIVGDGSCDVPEYCTGSDASCPVDAVKPVGTVCRPAAGVCDVPDSCDGTNKGCGIDVKSFGNQCRAPDPTKACDAGAVCDGHDDCPPSTPKPKDAVCRPSGGLACDPTDTCDGVSYDCPPNAPAAAGTECAAADVPGCLLASQCDGSSYFCPVQQQAPQGTSCEPAGPCEGEGFCTIIGRCAHLADPDGSPCMTADTNMPGTCLAKTCNAIVCKYGIQCPDGYVCQDTQCVQASPGTAGASCVGGAASGSPDACGTGLLCCASLQTDGQGSLAGAGAEGRCAECCGDTVGQGRCAVGHFCCDGTCHDVTTDESHCGGCAYAGGVDCFSNTNACQPGTSCVDETCLYSNGCGSAPSGSFYNCTLPTTGEPSQFCLDACQTALTTCNDTCADGPAGQTCRDNCSLFDYACTGACPPQYDPACLTSPYTGCAKTCTLEGGSCYASGQVCGTNADCCSGVCQSSCPGGLAGALCNDPSTCQ